MAIAADLGRLRSSTRVELVFLGVAVVGGELLLGAALASGHRQMAIAAVLGAAAAVLVVKLPFAATCTLLVLVASTFDEAWPAIPLAGRTVFPYELLLAALLGLAIARPRRRTWGGAAGLTLALFLGMLALSSLVAVRSGSGSLNDVLLWGRVFFVLTFFWVVVRLFPTREEVVRLLKAAAIIGGLTGFVAVLFALGLSHEWLFRSSGDSIVSGDGALRRVRLPGLALSFALLWLIALFVARGVQPRWLWWLVLAGSLANVLVSLNRNMWVAAIAGLAILLQIGGHVTRARVVTSIAILGAAISLLVLVPQTSGPTLRAVQPLVERGQTLLDPSRASQEDSLKDRQRENRAGWASAKENLALGIGPGVSWGLYAIDLSRPSPSVNPQLFLHNQYLYLLVITGLPGLLLFLAFLVRSLRDGFMLPREPPEIAMLAIGMVTLALTAFVMLSLTYPSYLLALMLLAGGIAALRRRESAP